MAPGTNPIRCLRPYLQSCRQLRRVDGGARRAQLGQQLRRVSFAGGRDQAGARPRPCSRSGVDGVERHAHAPAPDDPGSGCCGCHRRRPAAGRAAASSPPSEPGEARGCRRGHGRQGLR